MGRRGRVYNGSGEIPGGASARAGGSRACELVWPAESTAFEFDHRAFERPTPNRSPILSHPRRPLLSSDRARLLSRGHHAGLSHKAMHSWKMASERGSRKFSSSPQVLFHIIENAHVPWAVGRQAVPPILASPSATTNVAFPHAAGRRAWCVLNAPQSRERSFLPPSKCATACLPRSTKDHSLGTVALTSVVRCADDDLHQSVSFDRCPNSRNLFRLTNSGSVKLPTIANLIENSLRYLRYAKKSSNIK